MNRNRDLIPALSVFLVFFATTSMADVVELDNGDRITGTAVRMEEDKLVFETHYAGEIEIDWAAVASFQSDATVTVILDDETSLRGLTEPADPGKIRLRLERLEEPVTFANADVNAINPRPPESPMKITARASLGSVLDKGNTDSEELRFQGQFIARGPYNRFSLLGEFDREWKREVLTKSKALASAKYDHFFGRWWYLTALASIERDDFKTLLSRSVFGTGPGLQVYESDRSKFAVEGGIAVVTERFDDRALDREFSAYFVASDLEIGFFQEKLLTFYHWNALYANTEEPDEDFFLRTRTGFRFPLYKRVHWSIQYNFDWDNTPAPGTVNSDHKFSTLIGFEY